MRTLFLFLFLSIHFPLLAASPEVFDLQSATQKNTASTIALIAKDDDDLLTYTIKSSSTNGVLSVDGTAVTYTGSDSFTYQVTDTQSATSTTSNVNLDVFNAYRATWLQIATVRAQQVPISYNFMSTF